MIGSVAPRAALRRRAGGARFAIVWVALVVAFSPRSVAADGGMVRMKGDAGPFALTLFSAEPLRAGVADLSVLVQRRGDGEAVLDAQVDLELERPGGALLRATATRAQATNKLLHAAVIDLDEEGLWKVRVTVRESHQTGELRGELLVSPAQPLAATLWPLLALPVCGVALFAATQWLRRRRATR